MYELTPISNLFTYNMKLFPFPESFHLLAYPPYPLNSHVQRTNNRFPSQKYRHSTPVIKRSKTKLYLHNYKN